MKKQVQLLIIAIVLMINFGCNKDNDKLKQIENILPGKWNIESYEIPKYGYGFYYKGDTITQDTILYNLGTLEFPEFSTDTLSLNYNNISGIVFNYKMDEDNFFFTIQKIFLSGEEYFLYFRQTIPFPDNVNPENLKFVKTSNIFSYNAQLNIEDENNIIIQEPSQDKTHIVKLRRI